MSYPQFTTFDLGGRFLSLSAGLLMLICSIGHQQVPLPTDLLSVRH